MSVPRLGILSGACLPARIRDLPEPPSRLHVVGEWPRSPSVAIVGTRKPTPEAVKYTLELAKSLAGSGVVVLSGGAEGIDTAAHRGALQGGGCTGVVAPAGWQRPYPEKNRQLFIDVLEAGGAYLSLVSPEIPAANSAFFPRNALLVALSSVVVVVQAGYRSGARNTAAWARRLRRSLFVVPSCPWIREGLGCNLELANGARPLHSPRQLVAQLERLGQSTLPLSAPAPLGLARGDPLEEPDSSEATLVAALTQGIDSLDGLCRTTGMSPSSVQVGLLQLTLTGRVRQDPAGRLKLVKC